MAKPYHCPNCKTNRTRFNLLKQQPQIVKLDQSSGEVISEYTNDSIEPFHMKYRGPAYMVQCGVCGLLEKEEIFTSYATYAQGKELT